VLLEALTGRRAFDGVGQEAVLARLARRPDVPESLGAEWSSLLADMTHPEAPDRPLASAVAARLGEIAAAAPAVLPVAPVVAAALGDDEPTRVIPGAGGPITGATTAAMSATERSDPTSVFPAAVVERRPGRRGLIWVALAALALILIGAAFSGGDPKIPTPTTTASGTAPTTTSTEAVAPVATAPPTTAAACAPPKKGHGEGNKGGDEQGAGEDC
jgi:hypothetical protein